LLRQSVTAGNTVCINKNDRPQSVCVYTISTRAATLQSAIQFSIGFLESLYRDTELALLFNRGRHDQQALSDDERVRFFLIMLGFMRMAQNVHHQFEQGLMSDDIWSGYRQSILRWVDSPGSRQWWTENAERFSGTFRSYLDRELERRAE